MLDIEVKTWEANNPYLVFPVPPNVKTAAASRWLPSFTWKTVEEYALRSSPRGKARRLTGWPQFGCRT